MVAVLTYGALKYERGNYKLVDDAPDRYYAALRRHLVAWRKGSAFDLETGLHHLAHAACCLAFLLGMDLESNPPLIPLDVRLTRALKTAREIRARREAGG